MSRFFTYPNPANTLSVPVAINQGGTGQVTANAGLNALLPTQTGQSGKYLTTNGTNTSWATVSSGGIASINGDTTSAQVIAAGSGISVATVSGTTTITATGGSGANTALSNLASVAINTDLLPSSDAAIKIGARTNRIDKIYSYTNFCELIQFESGTDNSTLVGTMSADGGASDVLIENNGDGVSTNAIGLKSAAKAGVSKNILIELATAASQGHLQIKDGSEGTSGHVWTSTDVNGTGHWAAAAGGGFTPEMFYSSAVTTNSAAFSSSYAAADNSPTFVFTPTYSGNYRVYFNAVLSTGSALTIGSLKVANTVGAATLVNEQVCAMNGNFAGGFQLNQFIESIYTLVGGTSYTFVVQGKDSAGSGTVLILNGSLGVSSKMIAERLT